MSMFKSLPLPEWKTLREAALATVTSWMLHHKLVGGWVGG